MYLGMRPALGQGDLLQPRTRATWNQLARTLWHELEELRFRPDDAAGLQARRLRLILLFESLAPWDAAELYGRLLLGRRNDPLARLFHHRLATPTRETLCRILRRKLTLI